MMQYSLTWHYIYNTSRAYQPKRFVYNYKKSDFNAFRDYLANIPWECTQMDDDIEENWQKWKDTFNAVVMECIPRVMWKPQKSKCWLNRETIKAIRKKRGLYRKAKRSGWDQDYARYRSASNSVWQLTRRDHQAHIEEIAANLQNSSTPNPFWSWLIKIVQEKWQWNTSTLYHGNEVHTTDTGKADFLMNTVHWAQYNMDSDQQIHASPNFWRQFINGLPHFTEQIDPCYILRFCQDIWQCPTRGCWSNWITLELEVRFESGLNHS